MQFLDFKGLSEFLKGLFGKFSEIGHKHTTSDITDYVVDSSLSSTSTNPIQNKVINAEFDAVSEAMGALELSIDSKADASHNHNDIYETKTDAETKLAEALDVASSAGSNALVQAKSYTNEKVKIINDSLDLKADASTVDSKISTHNTSTSAHSDIRDLITGLTTRLNALADSDDTTLDQMSEIVAYIKANKTLIESITTSKINVSDIVNNLTTNSTSKVLSAAQGVAIKALIDALETELDSHTHAIADVSGLQSALDGKAASSHGTHVSFDSTNKPKMDGTSAFGTSTKVARADHVHPTDTSRASQSSLDSHTGNTTSHITSTERTNWNSAKTHADSAHAPSNAQANQNAFSNIKVGSTTISADTTTDTLELVGSNVTITPDSTNDKVTIAVADGSTSAKGLVQLTNSTSSTSTTTAATPSSVKSAYDLANTAKTNAATAQSRADSAYSLAESKADSLSDLGVTATATELNYVDGVTSNIQTQLNGKATSGHTHNYAGSSSAGGAATSAVKLATARTINGVSFDGTSNITHYGTCSTAAATAAKTVALTSFALVTGAKVMIKFTVTNTASSPTLNVNSTGAKSIMYRGAAITAGYLASGRVYEFVYDGTNWELVGDINTDNNTKNTAGSTNSSSKLFLIGATSQATNPQTYSHDTAYVGTDGCLYSGGKRVDTEVISSTEPTSQITGDFWLQAY